MGRQKVQFLAHKGTLCAISALILLWVRSCSAGQPQSSAPPPPAGCFAVPPPRRPAASWGMAYRPYPDADRALRQLRRHPQSEPVVAEFSLRLAGQANLALETVAAALRPTLDAMRHRQAAPRTELTDVFSKLRHSA